MAKACVLKEAAGRKGLTLEYGGRPFRFSKELQAGTEGVVQKAFDVNNRRDVRFKCFWEPSDVRKQRSVQLADIGLSDPDHKVDALGGAPYEIMLGLGPCTPFALIMKDIAGESWKTLLDNAKYTCLQDKKYPPENWPARQVRASWAYGLSRAVSYMEEQRFVHCDLSGGNVMVTPAGEDAGNMALVDFDAFIHPAYPHSDMTCKGTDGYAASEIRAGSGIGIGSDRLAMAILVQEFLLAGDPLLSAERGFSLEYTQDSLNDQTAKAHPEFTSRYPALAELVTRTLQAKSRQARPEPKLWREPLWDTFSGKSLAGRKKLVNVTLNNYPLPKGKKPALFSDHISHLNLASTMYPIRADLIRNQDGSLDLVAHQGATLKAQTPANMKGIDCVGGMRIPVCAGMIVWDKEKSSIMQIQAQEGK